MSQFIEDEQRVSRLESALAQEDLGHIPVNTSRVAPDREAAIVSAIQEFEAFNASHEGKLIAEFVRRTGPVPVTHGNYTEEGISYMGDVFQRRSRRVGSRELPVYGNVVDLHTVFHEVKDVATPLRVIRSTVDRRLSALEER